ncbi:MAG: MATE family efflux transporter [Betaproteobacteria bacterium]|nr:MATE family efflux transporter [Betaproteobacteria bacterium]
MPLHALPAARLSASGTCIVDYAAVMRLALPLFINIAIQAILNVTDIWFIGRISVEATAAIGAINWLVIIAILDLGGLGMGVQSLVAQAHGAKRYRRATSLTWNALWGTLLVLPLFLLVSQACGAILAPFGLQKSTVAIANQFWEPRLQWAAVSTALWAVSGFFNGIGRPVFTLCIMAVVAISNVLLNAWFMFGLGLGIAGVAWATNLATETGLIVGMGLFISKRFQSRFATRLLWRMRWPRLRAVCALGFPIGLFFSVDLFGLALFQLMTTKVGETDGAATQIVMTLTSIAYWPGIGIAMAGTTLVGTAMGAKRPGWAFTLGKSIGMMTACYMGAVGLVLALLGAFLMSTFAGANDPHAPEVARLGITLLWIAAAYQFFDGLNLGFGACLRGAGDVVMPTLWLAMLSLGVFIPLTHMLTFAPGQGWVAFLPQLAYGAPGAWGAAFVYVALLGSVLALRWRGKRWMRTN